MNMRLSESRLKDMAKTCAFSSALDGELKTQIIQGSNSVNFQTKAIESALSTLADIIKLGRTIEAVSKQIQEMRRGSSGHFAAASSEEQVNQLRESYQEGKKSKDFDKPRKCFNCGKGYPHEKDKECPALNKTCQNCKRRNHLAK